MQTPLTALSPGQAFTYGGVRWVKLDEINGMVFVIAAEPVFSSRFGNYNNWAQCTLREDLNRNFYGLLLDNGASGKAFINMTTNLTADDGLDDYGVTKDKIALLSCEQYRKYRKLIPVIDNYWWTVTPNSCGSNNYPYKVRIVTNSGTLNMHEAYYILAVRPVCCLWANTTVVFSTNETSANGSVTIQPARTHNERRTRYAAPMKKNLLQLLTDATVVLYAFATGWFIGWVIFFA